MKQLYFKCITKLLFCFTLLFNFQESFAQTPSPGTMEFGSSLVVLANSTNPSANASVNTLLNNFDVSGVSSNDRFIAFANSGNEGGTDAIGSPTDHVLTWTGNISGSFSSGTMSSTDGTEFGITAMEFAYAISTGGAPTIIAFTFEGKKDGNTVGTIVLSTPPHNTEINIDFTSPTTGSFADIDEIVITPAAPISGGFSVDEMVIITPVSNTDPTIVIDNTTLNYTEGNAATQIDAIGTVNDADGDADWNGGTLVAQITGNAEATDEISISDTDGDGTAITVSGTNILANGLDIGDLSVSGGIATNNTTLTITFDSNATNANVQEVLQSLRYRSTSTTPGTSIRTITITANDANAGTANDTRTVSVSTVPNTTSVNVPFNGTYIASQNLDFTINFDENIIVNTTGGTPQLAITIGSTTRQATYQGGSGTTTLAFRYTVQAGDVDSDGISVGTLSANGGTLQNGSGTDADLTLNSIGVTTGVLVSAPITLTITGLTGDDKVYDDTTAASAFGTATLSGVVGGDDVSLGGSPVFTFASANVGTGITINTTGYTISGTDSGKYILTQPTLSGDITAKELTITGLTGDDKVYDDTTAASAFGTATLVGVESGDDVSLGGSPVFTFASANVGTGITINTTGYTISGTDSGNYTLTQPTLSGDITTKELTITGLTGDDKVYDDTTAASAFGTATLVGVESGDDVSLGGSPVFTFASANVGTGITINTTGYTISGTDSGNYTLTQPTLSGDITAKELTITGLTGDDKVYDDTTAASAFGTATLVGVESGDDVSLGGSPVFTFASANVGTGITINTTGYTISGTDSGNYTLTQPTLSGDITAKELTITGLTGDDKVYDDTTAASAFGTATLVGVESGDDVSLGGSPVFTFASANVGTGITINTTGYTISGTDSGNYTLTQPTLSGDITAKELTITGLTGSDKEYDDTTAASASGTATLNGVETGDDVSLGGSPVFTFASANVGTGITINTTGYTISGTDSGNYTLTQPTLSGDITAKELTITGLTGDNKVFDGTTNATATGTATLNGVETGDDVSLGGSPVFTFISASVGTGITINTTGYTISGTDSGNYTLTQPTLSGDITSAAITWTGTTNNDWNTASNWNTNMIPVSSSDVTIPNGITNYPTISSAVTVNSINIASGASLIANASVTGSTTYTRNLPTTNWYLVSAPVSGETQQDIIAGHTFATGSGSNIGIGAFTNNGVNPWVYATNATSGPLVSGAGVSMKLAAAGDVTITGNVNTTNVSFPIATGTRNNFNLIGNPYTSFVSSSTFASANTGLLSEETVWLWDGSQYVTYNSMSPIQIAPAQGFFIEASGSGNVTFSTANQSHQGSDTFMRQVPNATFELFIDNGTNKKSTKVFYADNKTKGFDNGADSKMFGGITQNFAVFTELLENNAGKKLAIQTLPNTNLDTMIIPVGLIAEANKEITFSVVSSDLPTGIEVYLEDRINNTFVNLSEGSHKIKTTSATNGTGQYYLHTTAKRLSNEDIINNFNNVSIYKSASQELTVTGLQGKASIKVFSILGKEVNKTVINSNGNSKINLPVLPSGVYVVRISSDLGRLTKKIILE
ncbi:YDG domain-containing protein [uncultured Tenacibaculum sp.]|uniref:YDG domain-containing protein n=1 Tax=uncultured Tenacibaculum sp. TaxID=174713 RepID=UPI00262E44BA|nr:YDG domain-containing protein [uncultured Tenacibaculum sp.]